MPRAGQVEDSRAEGPDSLSDRGHTFRDGLILPTPKSLRYGGGRLARDLTLPRLREGWRDRPDRAQVAVDEWRVTAKNPWQYRPVAPGREETTPVPEMWKQ